VPSASVVADSHCGQVLRGLVAYNECSPYYVRNSLLKNYSDHAANERTYLAWVRTGITVSVFGFVIEKFELFVTELPRLAMGQSKDAILPSPEIRILSMLLVVLGIGVILLSTWHFVSTRRAIESKDFVAYNEVLPAYVLSALLSLAGIALLIGLVPLI